MASSADGSTPCPMSTSSPTSDGSPSARRPTPWSPRPTWCWGWPGPRRCTSSRHRSDSWRWPTPGSGWGGCWSGNGPTPLVTSSMPTGFRWCRSSSTTSGRPGCCGRARARPNSDGRRSSAASATSPSGWPPVWRRRPAPSASPVRPRPVPPTLRARSAIRAPPSRRVPRWCRHPLPPVPPLRPRPRRLDRRRRTPAHAAHAAPVAPIAAVVARRSAPAPRITSARRPRVGGRAPLPGERERGRSIPTSAPAGPPRSGRHVVDPRRAGGRPHQRFARRPGPSGCRPAEPRRAGSGHRVGVGIASRVGTGPVNGGRAVPGTGRRRLGSTRRRPCQRRPGRRTVAGDPGGSATRSVRAR